MSVDDQRVPHLFTEPQAIAPKEHEDASFDTKRNADAAIITKPAGLVIETLGVAMPVVAVGLEDDGAMEIPEDVMTAGHYNPGGLGVLPGSPGTAVFAAHVDSRQQGRGALYELSTMNVNDLIGIASPDGTMHMWRVTEVVTYRKEVLPFDDLFTFAGPSRIAVITCGGEFDRSARSYTHNVVVLAEPTDSAAS
ncbi:MAG: class F sortase [Nitriliruptoraceae bacterium]